MRANFSIAKPIHLTDQQEESCDNLIDFPPKLPQKELELHLSQATLPRSPIISPSSVQHIHLPSTSNNYQHLPQFENDTSNSLSIQSTSPEADTKPRQVIFVPSEQYSSPMSAQDFNIPAKKYILYLESRRDCPFYQSILEFFRISKDRYGLNEAHMYHPHTSLTGFFEIPLLDNGLRSLDQDIVEILSEALNLHHITTGETTPSPNFPRINSFRIRKNALSVSLEVPDKLKQAVLYFKSKIEPLIKQEYYETQDAPTHELPPFFTIRPKPMDHISLAYLKNVHDHLHRHELSNEDLGEIQKLAESVVRLDELPDAWFVRLYQVDLRSFDINVPHQFTLLHSWTIQ